MERFSEIEKKYVDEVLKNEFRTSLNSVFTTRLEAKFAKIFNRRFAISHINGTATLHTALSALGVKADDEVIIPPLTMSSTALAVLQNNSIPVFADVDRKTFNISSESIIKNITKKTKAIISVSLYGLPPDYGKILEICRKRKIPLIEDNAESFFAEYGGKLAGEFGDFASFSFQASKHLTCGEGGMLITNDEKLANSARRFSSLGYASVSAKKGKISKTDIQDPNFSRHISLGWNYRMSELQSAVLLGQLERAQELIEVRVKAADLFNHIINDVDWLIPQYVTKGYKNTYWSYSVVLDVEDPEKGWYKFRDLFLENGGDGIYAAWKLTYLEPYFLSEVQNYRGIWQKYCKGLCLNAEYLQKRMLQFKTNYWKFEEAEKQGEILRKTIKEFEKKYL